MSQNKGGNDKVDGEGKQIRQSRKGPEGGGNTMIRPEMAQKFIDQITEYTDYNINIMDETGVIIASRDPKRVGTYHEAADRIIRGSEEIVTVDDEKIFPGVLPGINMAIMVNGRKEGVVGVTGSPAHIREVAMITRLAIEAMLKYEKQQENLLLRQGRKENFFQLLVRVENADPNELRAAAQLLGYEESIIRVPILCRILDNTPADRILETIRSNDGHWIQDLSTILDDTHVLLFRTLRENRRGGAFSLRREILSYMNGTLRRMDRGGMKAVFFVGTPQSAFTQYIYAYRHCKWLESRYRHLTDPAGDDRVKFFYDKAAEYFYSVLPREELHRVFYQYGSQLQGDERKQLIDTVAALIETNFNLTEAAKALFVHKNTMMYRYNKMKDMLDIDPIRSSSDRTFLILLYHSL